MSGESGLSAENVYNYVSNSLDLINEITNNIDNIIKNKDNKKLEELTKEQLERLNISKTLLSKINSLNILDNYFYVKLEKIQKALEITDKMPLKMLDWASEILYNISFDYIEIDLYKYLSTIELVLHFRYERNGANEKEYTLKNATFVIKSTEKDDKKYIDIYTNDNLKQITAVENYLDILELANRLIS